MKQYAPREINIRPVKPGDREALAEIWERQKLTLGDRPGEFADPSHPAQFATVIIEDAKTGKVVGAGAARTVCETAMILDPDWGTPRDRLRVTMQGSVVLYSQIKANGFGSTFARIVGKHRWADRLIKKMGWTLEPHPYVSIDLDNLSGGTR
jgi:hypothetical protein